MLSLEEKQWVQKKSGNITSVAAGTRGAVVGEVSQYEFAIALTSREVGSGGAKVLQVG